MLTELGFLLLGATSLAHVGSIAIASGRLARPWELPPPDEHPPKVTIIRPVCGIENNIEPCLASSFHLSYPGVELLFCCDDEDDPVLAMLRRLVAENPRVDAHILIGRDRVGANPKLNNVVKGWREATGEWIVLSDSNALLPPDYVERLLARVAPGVGVVSTAAEVTWPEGFAAELECAFMNAFQARWVLAADSVGRGFALGKTLMYRRETIDGRGGLGRLAEQAAEDIASTHLMREAGLRARLAQRPVAQPVGRRSLRAVLQRQTRWARLRRAGLRAVYLAEPLSGGAVPIAVLAALTVAGMLPVAAAAAFVLAWYGLELGLVRIAGWPLSWRTLPALLLRDAMTPGIWVAGWIGSRFEWRGHAMTVAPKPRREPAGSP